MHVVHVHIPLYVHTMYPCSIECALNRSNLVVAKYVITFGFVSLSGAWNNTTHQNCFALLMQRGVEVPREIEQQLGLKKPA